MIQECFWKLDLFYKRKKTWTHVFLNGLSFSLLRSTCYAYEINFRVQLFLNIPKIGNLRTNLGENAKRISEVIINTQPLNWTLKANTVKCLTEDNAMSFRLWQRNTRRDRSFPESKLFIFLAISEKKKTETRRPWMSHHCYYDHVTPTKLQSNPFNNRWNIR